MIMKLASVASALRSVELSDTYAVSRTRRSVTRVGHHTTGRGLDEARTLHQQRCVVAHSNILHL
jgi:hypothetical protein